MLPPSPSQALWISGLCINVATLRGSIHDQKKAMINLFDLSAGMSSTNMLTDRPRRDGSPPCRSRQDVKRTVDPAKVYAEDKLGATNWSSSSNKSNASPLDVVLAKEMSMELELKKKPPSVVARLMGLEDDLPGQKPTLQSAKRNLKKSHLNGNLAERNSLHPHQEQCNSSMTTLDMHIGHKETVQFKDVYEVNEEPLRTYHLQDQTFRRGMSSRSKRDIRMEIVRQKFMEAKRLATNEKLLHSKEFQEALEVLSSNRDLFLKFLGEPNSTFSKQLSGFHRSPLSPQTKRITVLKPNKSVENEARREIRTNRINEENEHVMPMTHRRSHSAEVTFSQPTRIVVLKPSPGKPNRTMAKLTPGAAPDQLTEQIGFCGGSEDDNYLPDSLHRRDESLLSSVYSNGYGGDESSLSRSEVDYIDEEDGNLSDPEIVSPVSRHSWDHIKRYNSPYSGSTFSRTSRSPESSVIREAKKRLSERWASVAYNDINQEQMQLPRSSRTLGEMLSLRGAKKEVGGMGSVSSSRPCDAENELTLQATCISSFREKEGDGQSSPKNLARSKSVPVSSSMFDSISPHAPSSNSEGSKTPNVVTRSDKGKSSLKGRVSSFFFPKSKKQPKEKITISASSHEKVEITCFGSMKPEAAQNIGADENLSFCEDKDGSLTTQTICSSKDIVSIEVPISSACPSGHLDGLRSGGRLNGSRDEPSPTSVLDAPFEDSNINESESSRSITCATERIALRSDAIESVTRSLSWEDMSSPSPSFGMKKLTPLSSVDNDELECVAFVQRIVSSAGLGDLQLGMVFTGWYLPDCPLDPALCDKLLDRKEEAAKSRERRSNQRLLFDYVNMTLVEIGQDTLLCAYPSSQVRSMASKETLSLALVEEVPCHMRDWLYGSGKFAVNENDDAGTILERIMQQEVEGRGWVKSMRWELDEITEQIAREVLEELVEETAGPHAPEFGENPCRRMLPKEKGLFLELLTWQKTLLALEMHIMLKCWILLDLHAYIADRENATSAWGKMSGGKAIRVTFCTAPPPLVSYICVWCPHGEIAMEPTVEAAEADLVLLRVSLRCRRQQGDYFVYKAAGSKGPSLQLLQDPRPCLPERYNFTLLLHRDVGGYPHAAGDDADDHYYIAALNQFRGSGPGDFKLWLFDSMDGEWSSVHVWLGDDVYCHITSKVIALGGDGLVGFVDPWRGIIVCDALGRRPARYLPFPPPLVRLAKLRDEPLLLRDIAFIEGRLTVVQLSPVVEQGGISDYWSWEISSWSRAVTDNGGTQQPTTPGKPKLYIAHPTLSLSDNGIVYIM
ncbi:hypothetical protein BAE44_0001939, partial [Dichanthelium oligosanthes]